MITITRLLGTRQEFKEQLWVALAMLLIAAGYEWGSSHVIPGFTFNWFEFIGTWTGLVCVWLSRTRNILCWPWGIAGAIAFGMFFGKIGLPGQQWLNLGYFLVIQLWAWPYWAFGGKDKTELPVTTLSWTGRFLWLAALVAGTAVVYVAIDTFSPGSKYPILDALVVASSVIAQFLLGRKKVESWILWLGPVNLASIVLFGLAGAYTAAALYVAFFVHAVIALRTWTNARSEAAPVAAATPAYV